MIIYYRRPDNTPDQRTSYVEWKAERQKAMDNRSAKQLKFDTIYQQNNLDNDFYFGLSNRIALREQSKVPVAGAGAVQFFSIASTVTRPLAKILPAPFLAIHGMFSFTEMVARERAGL